MTLFSAQSAFAQSPASAATPGKEPSLAYMVKPSDSVSKVSRDILTDPSAWQEVAKFNQLKNANVIFPGQTLAVPLRFLKFSPANGKVVSAEGDVTLQGAPVQTGAAVTDGSKIKTGANSSAVIELGDGSRIKILPSSLAEIVTSRDYAMRDASQSGSTNWFSGLMRLTEGALEAIASKATKRATPLQVETPTSLIGVRGTEFRVAIGDATGKTSRAEVLEGLVRADNPAQASGADLPLGTGAVVNPLEKDVKVVALLPAPDLSSVPSEVFKPLGSWPMPTLAGASAYAVQIASDAQFDKIVRDLKVVGNSGSTADLANLPNGNWFARVRGVDAVGLQGFNSVKLIAVKDAVVSQWRVTQSTLRFVNGVTILEWAGQLADGQPLPVGNYSAVLAGNVALTQSAQTLQASAGQSSVKSTVVLGDLKPGVYFIRLQSAGGSTGSLSSQTYRFELSGNWAQTVFDQIFALQAVN